MLDANQPVRPRHPMLEGAMDKPQPTSGDTRQIMDQYARIREQLIAKQAELVRRLASLKENLTAGPPSGLPAGNIGTFTSTAWNTRTT